jgi:hypothetical protein
LIPLFVLFFAFVDIRHLLALPTACAAAAGDKQKASEAKNKKKDEKTKKTAGCTRKPHGEEASVDRKKR